MPTSRSLKRSARWPFWLLVAAWCCANTPQAATFELILWLKGAAYFSHQADLKAEVALILSGAPKAAHLIANQSVRETPPPAVPLAKNVTIKRVGPFLVAESIASVATGASAAIVMTNQRVPERQIARPRLRPPRLAGA
jgi:hypothetical protein